MALAFQSSNSHIFLPFLTHANTTAQTSWLSYGLTMHLPILPTHSVLAFKIAQSLPPIYLGQLQQTPNPTFTHSAFPQDCSILMHILASAYLDGECLLDFASLVDTKLPVSSNFPQGASGKSCICWGGSWGPINNTAILLPVDLKVPFCLSSCPTSSTPPSHHTSR